jgi:hypothetical protein
MELKAPKILIYGKPGTGKTAFSTTMADVTQVIDFDGGLLTCKSFPDKFQPQRLKLFEEGGPFKHVRECFEDDPSKATAFNKAMSILKDISEEERSGKYLPRILVIDSLTTLADFAVRAVLFNNGMLGKAPQIQHWGLAIISIEEFLMLVRCLRKTVVILLAHTDSDMVEGVMQANIAVPGQKLPSKITSYFDEILYAKTVNGAAGKVDFVLQTRNTPSAVARTRANLPDKFNMDEGLSSMLKLMGWDIPLSLKV